MAGRMDRPKTSDLGCHWHTDIREDPFCVMRNSCYIALTRPHLQKQWFYHHKTHFILTQQKQKKTHQNLLGFGSNNHHQVWFSRNKALIHRIHRGVRVREAVKTACGHYDRRDLNAYIILNIKTDFPSLKTGNKWIMETLVLWTLSVMQHAQCSCHDVQFDNIFKFRKFIESHKCSM